ncbi:MAG: hypothetical protein PGN12_12155 [Sphingomonas phyllosphaerae]
MAADAVYRSLIDHIANRIRSADLKAVRPRTNRDYRFLRGALFDGHGLPAFENARAVCCGQVDACHAADGTVTSSVNRFCSCFHRVLIRPSRES